MAKRVPNRVRIIFVQVAKDSRWNVAKITNLLEEQVEVRVRPATLDTETHMEEENIIGIFLIRSPRRRLQPRPTTTTSRATAGPRPPTAPPPRAATLEARTQKNKLKFCSGAIAKGTNKPVLLGVGEPSGAVRAEQDAAGGEQTKSPQTSRRTTAGSASAGHSSAGGPHTDDDDARLAQRSHGPGRSLSSVAGRISAASPIVGTMHASDLMQLDPHEVPRRSITRMHRRNGCADASWIARSP